MLTDADLALVRQAAGGDASAYEELIRRRMDGIFRLCFATLGSHSDAADVTQDALLVAWRELRRLRDPASFDAWLRRIAYNACRMHLRHRRRVREIHLDAAAGLGRADADPATGMGLGAALAGLEHDQRAILALHYLDDAPLAEIAMVLDVPVGTVKSRLHAARRALAHALDLEEALP